MKPRHKRMAVIAVGVVGLTVAALFVLNAFRNNLVFFYSPTEVLEGKAPPDRTFRIGGLVEKGSVHRSKDGLKEGPRRSSCWRVTAWTSSSPI